MSVHVSLLLSEVALSLSKLSKVVFVLAPATQFLALFTSRTVVYVHSHTLIKGSVLELILVHFCENVSFVTLFLAFVLIFVKVFVWVFVELFLVLVLVRRIYGV